MPPSRHFRGGPARTRAERENLCGLNETAVQPFTFSAKADAGNAGGRLDFRGEVVLHSRDFTGGDLWDRVAKTGDRTMRKLLVPAVLAMALAACTQTQTNRAVVGGAVGAGLGAVTGAAISGNAGGALTGAAIGGVGGAAVGAATAQ